MSLLEAMEDIYLEDEAVDGFERVIEGDEYDDNRVVSENESDGNKEDEAEEDKRKIDPSRPKKKEVRNPRITLNPARLTGPRGIHTIQNYFKDFKFQGRGYESEDLDMMLKKLEHWAHRLYPKFQFDDCLEKIETLGKKRAVMTQVKKIRLNLFEQVDDSDLRKDSSDEDEAATTVQEPDEFDKLLEQQIALVRSTPESIVKNSYGMNGISDSSTHMLQKPYFVGDDTLGVSCLPETLYADTQTLAQNQTKANALTEEQKERMLRNRVLAEERRLARMKKAAIEDAENDTNTNYLANSSVLEDAKNDTNTNYVANSSVLETIAKSTEEIEARIHGIEKQNHVSKDIVQNMADSVEGSVDFDKSLVCEGSKEENGKLTDADNIVDVMDLDIISEDTK